jgi:pyrimidine operon attenuation protein/uracil phosphoribosyltransferase
MKQARQKTSGAAVPTMDAEAIRRALQRIAHEIIERNPQLTHVALAGIPSRGVEIAQRIAAFIHQIRKINVETGVIDVAMHRDDVGTRSELPIVRESKLPLPLEQRTVIVVDDVLYTGRTVRAAMDALFDHGRPRRVQLCVLIDRGHRELPIEAAFIGRTVQTSDSEIIEVKLNEIDKEEQVLLVERIS